MRRLAINGRFVGRPRTGVETVALEVSRRLPDADIVRPTLSVSSGPVGHIWEQSILLARTRREFLWSPCNFGPVLHQNHAVTIHDIAPFDHPEWFSQAYMLAFTRVVGGLTRNAKRLICPSEATADRLIHRFALDSDRIVVIPPGAPIPWPSFDTSQFILTVGSHSTRKNLQRLLDAWRTSHLHERGWTLLVVGAKTGKAFHRNPALTIPPGVSVVGYLDDAALREALATASGYIAPSVYEGSALPLLEAAAMSLPIAASDIAAFRETFAREEIFWFDAESTDEMSRGLLDLAASKGCRNSYRSSKRTWTEVAADYEQVFGGLC